MRDTSCAQACPKFQVSDGASDSIQSDDDVDYTSRLSQPKKLKGNQRNQHIYMAIREKNCYS